MNSVERLKDPLLARGNRTLSQMVIFLPFVYYSYHMVFVHVMSKKKFVIFFHNLLSPFLPQACRGETASCIYECSCRFLFTINIVCCFSSLKTPSGERPISIYTLSRTSTKCSLLGFWHSVSVVWDRHCHSLPLHYLNKFL